MTHMHVAGAIHADVSTPSPQWLHRPVDPNALDPALWSCCVARGDDGALRVGGLSVAELLADYGSPLYLIDERDFRNRAAGFRDAFDPWHVYYAGKAFLTRMVARWVDQEGLFLDVCSGGELATALSVGFHPERIGMHGNNKSTEELAMALEAGVARIIVDSMDEIARIEQLCHDHGWKASVLIRVTPGVEAHTHEYIATAHEDQKFGFSITNGAAMVAMVRCHVASDIELLGIHSHIGSQIFDTGGFEVAARRTMKLLRQFKEATGTELPELDLGGGFGIAYTSNDSPATPDTLSRNLREIVEIEARGHAMKVPQISIEPGRAIVGPSGMALYTVGTVKTVDLEGGAQRVYVSVDGGMSDNIRPALYAAEYSAVLASRTSQEDTVLSRIVGKHCEGGDILVHDVFLPSDIAPGDLIAVPASGAYSRAMASNYNHTPRPPVLSVADGAVSVLLRRETFDDLMALDMGE
ncbi:diaminopimelate decarboxylase [Propionibacterium sp. oral taxon 192]|uniref:diaminopimelate decarboxylase n=1 Tax=Propionibacterium sp. oral taxon 192 TaxID=671222 RepID=UPI000A055FFA|nr:diaminopimelate decarboxylase [Propionibacterium sp. oral taxon 192]